MAEPIYNKLPKMTLREIATSANYSAMVEICNYNFKQIYVNGGGRKGDQGEKGEKGDPGATRKGIPGNTGEKGTVIWYYNGTITDGDLISSLGGNDWVKYRVNDTIVDANSIFYNVQLSPYGDMIAIKQIAMSDLIVQEMWINEEEYYPVSVSQSEYHILLGSDGNSSAKYENAMLVSRTPKVDDNNLPTGESISNYRKIIIGADRDPGTSIVNSLTITNINKDDEVNPFNHISFRYRKDKVSTTLLNSVSMKYREELNTQYFELYTDSNSGIWIKDGTGDSASVITASSSDEYRFYKKGERATSSNAYLAVSVDGSGDGLIKPSSGKLAIGVNSTTSEVSVNSINTKINGNTEVGITTPLIRVNSATEYLMQKKTITSADFATNSLDINTNLNFSKSVIFTYREATSDQIIPSTDVYVSSTFQGKSSRIHVLGAYSGSPNLMLNPALWPSGSYVVLSCASNVTLPAISYAYFNLPADYVLVAGKQIHLFNNGSKWDVLSHIEYSGVSSFTVLSNASYTAINGGLMTMHRSNNIVQTGGVITLTANPTTVSMTANLLMVLTGTIPTVFWPSAAVEFPIIIRRNDINDISHLATGLMRILANGTVQIVSNSTLTSVGATVIAINGSYKI